MNRHIIITFTWCFCSVTRKGTNDVDTDVIMSEVYETMKDTEVMHRRRRIAAMGTKKK